MSHDRDKSNHLRRLIRQATFSDPSACLENVEYLPDRNLKQEELLRLGSCNYVHERHNVIFLGATGSGKTYLACALGMAAVRQFLPVKYIRLPDLLVDFSIARGNGTIRKLMTQYKKYSLLIIDEWLLLKPSEEEARVIFDLLHKRRERSSTIFCSQYHQNEWYDQLGGEENPLSDAILDRIIHDSYEINITSVTPDKDISMREVYGLKNKEQEGKYGEAGE